jgi:hypothetical protein
MSNRSGDIARDAALRCSPKSSGDRQRNALRSHHAAAKAGSVAVSHRSADKPVSSSKPHVNYGNLNHKSL